MYFPDLSIYSYLDREAREGLLNIGWLDEGASFERSTPGQNFIDRVWEYSRVAVAGTRGFHGCNLCPGTHLGVPTIKHQGKTLKVASAEIRVFGKHGRIYAAPNMIFHYITDHQYLPPPEFVDAVLNLPGPESPEYFANLNASKMSWKILEFLPDIRHE